jgi:hypothetical protein
MENKIKMLHEEERSLYKGKIVLPNKITDNKWGISII